MGNAKSITHLAEVDARTALNRCQTEGERSRRLEESRKTVEIRARTFKKKLFYPLVLLLASIAVAWISQQMAVFWLTAGQLGVSSALVFAWAGMSRLGWHAGSISGRTTVERADTLIFNILCAIGMYLAALAVM